MKEHDKWDVRLNMHDRTIMPHALGAGIGKDGELRM